MNNPLRITFFGSSLNSLTVLKSLIDAGYSAVAVVTVPPKPVGRRRLLTPTPVHTFATDHNVPVLHDSLKVEPFKVDVSVIADYARLLPPEVLKIPQHGCLNLHPSLLPKYKGASPAEYAILAGEKETGMTIIKMDEQFDHGSIISQFKEAIRPDDTSETLYQRLFTAGAQVLITILPAWVEGRITPREQDHTKASFAPRLSRDDGFIPWKTLQKAIAGQTLDSSDLSPLLRKIAATYHPPLTTYHHLLNRAVRALYPWPGVWTVVPSPKGEKRLKILTSHVEEEKLVLDQVQLEGRQPSTISQIKTLLVTKT